MEEEKFKHIEKEGSIFIDNHFLERAQVHKELGIPVFDVDAIESLI
jgi:aspartate 1-decarboxylase